MSTGKRLAKRSILGTRVSAPGEDGKFYPGIIAAMKTCGDQNNDGGGSEDSPMNGSSSDASCSEAAAAAAVASAEGGGPGGGESKYSVRFEATRRVKEFKESEIIGPGFQNVTSSKLRAGQIVYVTHCNREMQGAVMHHRPNIDQVIIQLLVSSSSCKREHL